MRHALLTSLATALVLLVAVAGFPGTLQADQQGRTSVLTPLSDGFDYPVGKPEATGYYKARGFWPGVHPGEDWNGRRGGNTDLGDPVYAIADGVVVASKDYRQGWGNCVIVRHAYRDLDGRIRMVDSQYAHLNRRFVRKYQIIRRGQKVGTIGTAHGRYYAHLHFEMRKNLKIGMNRTQFPRTYDHYFNPTAFIKAHRKLRTGKRYRIPINTFAPYGQKVIPSQRDGTRKSIVPIRPNGKKNNPDDLNPELEKIIDDTRGDEGKGEELDNFWKRLREKLRRKK